MGPDLISRIDDLPAEKIVAMAQAYFAFSQQSPETIPPREPDELRPFLSFQAMRWMSSQYGFGFDPKSVVSWQDEDAPARVEDALKRVLLYCHRAVVDDPIIYMMDYFTEGEPSNSREYGYRTRLAHALSLVSYLRPLIETGVLAFVAQDRDRLKGPSLPRPADFDQIVNRADFRTINPQLPDNGHRVARSRWASEGFESAKVALRLAEIFPDRFDIYFPDSVFRDVAASMLSELATSVGTTERHTSEIRQLIEIEIPSLDGLTVTDIVSIRNNADGFALWRQSLREALGRADAIDSTIDSANDKLAEVREHLEVARIQVLKEVGDSPALKSVSKGAMRFGTGTLVDTVADPKSAVRSAAVSAVKDLGQAAGDAALDTGRGDKALFRHYSLFQPSLS